MELTLLARLRGQGGLNPPATPAALALLGELPPEIATLYLDHDGSVQRASGMAARLLPAQEAHLVQSELSCLPQDAELGRVLWLWTDDQQNYVGVYVDGVLEGYVAKLDHEEPLAVPAWTSVESFLTELLRQEHADLIELPRELPVETRGPGTQMSVLCYGLRDLFHETDDEHLRQLRAQSALALSANDQDVMPWLEVDDEWIPESALGLLRLRGYQGPTAPLERLALQGPNADAAALRLLVQMGAQAALDRIKPKLSPRMVDLLRRLR